MRVKYVVSSVILIYQTRKFKEEKANFCQINNGDLNLRTIKSLRGLTSSQGLQTSLKWVKWG